MGYEEKFAAPALRLANYLDSFPTTYNVYFMGMVSCVSGIMFGFDIASISGFLADDDYLNFFNSPNSNLQGIISASMALGSFFGCFVSAVVSEPFGRRVSLFLSSFFWIIGAAIQSSSQNVAQLICGRLIAGFGVGFGSTVAPVYGSEVSPRKIRGAIGCLFQFCVTLGILIMFLICYGLTHIHGVASFRIAWGLQMVPGLISLVCLFFIPESPRWYAKQGHWEKCEFIVSKIHKAPVDDPEVKTELAEISDQLQEENARAFRYIDLFSKRYRRRTFHAVFAQIWQQLTGMNTLMYYIVYIFQQTGYTGNTELVSGIIQYVLNVVMTIPAFFIMDRVGRRPILLVGAALMMTWEFAIGGILATYGKPVDAYVLPTGEKNTTVRWIIPSSNAAAGKAVIACCYLFVCSFAPTWGVGIWGYCAEIWGDSASRQRGAAVTTAADWALNFAIGMFTPSAFKNITWKTYIIFGVFCATMFLHVLFFFPETKDKRLEEIGQMWDAKVPAWRSASWKPKVPDAVIDSEGKVIPVHHEETVGSVESSRSGSENKAEGTPPSDT